MPGARTAATVVLVACATTLMAALLAARAAGQEPRPAAGQPVAMLRTWAVLASEELRKSGLEDQVLAGLGADKTMTLVDREHLDLVAREQALASLLDSSGAGFRRQAGAAVKADALVILNHESIEGKQYVRLVVCETRGGARLRVELIALEDGKSDEAGKAIVSAIQDVRKHFAQGVKRVYGVPPFVSRCLTHEYDHLQRGYSSLLADALSQQPAVAVIEVEEARQIAREIALTDGQDLQRLVPVFVEGEYQVPVGATGDAEVEFTVRLTAADGDLPKLPVRKVRLSEAARYVGVELPALIGGLEDKDPVAGMSAEQQVLGLVGRADAFAHLGGWEHSTGLREAALLLKDAPAQRRLLVEEYLKIVRTPLPPGMKIGKGDDYKFLSRYRWRNWELGLSHLEYLIRNEQVDAKWASYTTEMFFHCSTFWLIGKAEQEVLARAEQCRKRFVRGIYGPVLRLKSGGKPVPYSGRSLLQNVMDRLRLDNKSWGREDLEFLYDLMENVIPADEHFRVLLLYERATFPGHRAWAVEPKEYVAFLERLERSGKLANRLNARLAHLALELPDLPLEQRLERVKSLMAEFAPIARCSIDQRDWLKSRKREIEEAIREQATTKPVMPPPTPVPPVPKEPVPQVTYEPLELQVQTLDGERVPANGKDWEVARYVRLRGLRLLNCGDFDVFWNEVAVLLHRQKNVLKEILVEPKAFFGDVKWDGRNLWVADQSGHIRLLSEAGKEVLRIGEEQGLPPCDQRLLLHPVEQGKMIAVGSFGPYDRMWAATIDLAGQQARVKVFHQATRVKTSSDPEDDQGDDLAACPIWVHEHQWGRDKPRLLLVGRGSIRGVMRPAPIEIDLETLDVSVSSLGDLCHAESDALYSHGGYLLYTRNAGGRTVLAIPPSRATEGGVPDSLGNTNTMRPYFLPWNGRLYFPGSPWLRIDPLTWRSETLTAERAPGDIYRVARWGVSIHHGIIFWRHRGGFYRVVIKEAPHADSVPSRQGTEGEPDNSVKPPASAASNR